MLSEQIEHHVEEEEQRVEGMFARREKAGVDMDALGEQLAARKAELIATYKKGGLPKPELTTMESTTPGLSQRRAHDRVEWVAVGKAGGDPLAFDSRSRLRDFGALRDAARDEVAAADRQARDRPVGDARRRRPGGRRGASGRCAAVGAVPIGERARIEVEVGVGGVGEALAGFLAELEARGDLGGERGVARQDRGEAAQRVGGDARRRLRRGERGDAGGGVGRPARAGSARGCRARPSARASARDRGGRAI